MSPAAQGTDRQARSLGGARSAVLSRSRSRPPIGLSRSDQESVQRLEQFGLTTTESRVLVALLRLGPSTVAEVARVAEVHRTNVYPLLEELRARGLAGQLPGKAAMWASAGHNEVVDRLFAAQQELVRSLGSELDQTRHLLSELVPEGPAPAPELSDVHYVSGATPTDAVYLDLLATATTEILVFNRPPFAWASPDVHPAIMDMLGRGISTRVLYRSGDMEGPEAAAARDGAEAYITAGVEARVVDELPTKLAVMDRRAALLAMLDPVSPEETFPPSLHVEHAGLAQSLAGVFDHYWAAAQPYEARPAPG